MINVSRLMDQRPDIVELDLNPVIVYEQGYAIVDARLSLASRFITRGRRICPTTG